MANIFVHRIVLVWFYLFIFLVGTSGFTQSLHMYKYIIVPESYAFLKNEPNKYDMNALTQFLFEKYGFQALLRTEDVPVDLQQNRCLGLTSDVLNESSLFTTKLLVVLKDCDGREVYRTKIGKSKIKEYKPAYHEALREAMKELGALRYTYREAKTKMLGADRDELPRDLMGVNPGGLHSPLPPEQEITVEEAASGTASSLSPSVSTSGNQEYIYREESYTLRPTSYGYTLVKSDGEVELGKVHKTAQRNVFIVKAGELSGTGRFDSYGNFILDRINPATDQLISDVFARKN